MFNSIQCWIYQNRDIPMNSGSTTCQVYSDDDNTSAHSQTRMSNTHAGTKLAAFDHQVVILLMLQVKEL